jgi:excisionase family DNA binding protein
MGAHGTYTITTVKEVAVFLQLAESAVYELVREGILPGRKIGRAWCFSRVVSEQWLAQPGTPGAQSATRVIREEASS